MLRSVTAVTISVQDLALTQRAYSEWLGYRTISQTVVSQEQAAVWNAPAAAGAPLLLMGPESGDSFRLRFVEAPATEGFAPLQCHGWNAVELLSRDPDSLAKRLANSPFAILGEPYDLSSDGSARAMQVLGPSGEVLYLTKLSGHHAEFFGTARSDVDRAFICVAGGPDHDAMLRFYGEQLGQRLVKTDGFRIKVLSRANGLPIDTLYPLASARLVEGYSFELDGYPDCTRPRARNDGALPPGIAMVSASVVDLDAVPLDWVSAPRGVPGDIYQGRRVALALGAAGEWLELIESGRE